MKKIMISLLLIAAFFTTKTMAQEVKNTFKVNPLSALFRTGSLFYERAVSPQSTIQLGFAFTGLKLDETKFRGLALTPEYRYFIKKKAPVGIYIAPFAKYQNYSITDAEDSGSYTSFGGGLSLGRQWVYNSGFVLDMFFGPSFNSGTYTAESGSQQVDINGGIDGFGLRVGIALGFGF